MASLSKVLWKGREKNGIKTTASKELISKDNDKKELLKMSFWYLRETSSIMHLKERES